MTNLYYTYRFQTKVKIDTVNKVLTSFLKNKDGDLTERERVLWAVSAFWLPLAMQESGNYTRQEITLHGLSAIQRLQQQIAYLALLLDLQIPNTCPLLYSTSAHSEAAKLNTQFPKYGTEGRQAQMPEASASQDSSTETEVFAGESKLESPDKTALSVDTSHIDKLFGI
jgi:hypothetical protein